MNFKKQGNYILKLYTESVPSDETECYYHCDALDDMMASYPANYQNDRDKIYELHEIEVKRLIGNKNLSSIAI